MAAELNASPGAPESAPFSPTTTLPDTALAPVPYGPNLFGVPASGPPPAWPAPSEEECFALWDRFAMPAHIREHSRLTALVAGFVADRAFEAGWPVQPGAVRASALLHDLAKDYTIRYGGNHAQLGGAWVVELTGAPAIARGVAHHVYWPWDLDARADFLPLAVIYADKRVRHDQIVSIEERYEDLFARYGKNDYILARIELSKRQVLTIEQTFNTLLGIELHAYSFAGRRLVD